jgi:hypothetical protein
MKTTTINSLASVSTTFTESELRPALTSAERRRLGICAWSFAVVGVVAFGAAVFSQTPAVAREMAAVKNSLRVALTDSSRGLSSYGASAQCLPGQFSVEQLQQPFPAAQQWELAGLRSL